MQLVIVDTTQIQPYIFGSNRLRENIGASHLVNQATEMWASGEAGKHSGQEVYAGGGNYVVLFNLPDHARAFTKNLSQYTLENAPNLQLVIAQQEFDWNNDVLARKLDKGFKQLAEQKRMRALSAPLLGVGVTAMCQSTGLPAVGITPQIEDDETSRYTASAEILAKWDSVQDANSRLTEMFKSILAGTPYEFPEDFDDLGRTSGEHSYIAVVHADGNGMGQRIQAIAEKYWDSSPNQRKQNEKYRDELKAFSEAVKQAGQNALRDMLEKLHVRLLNDSPQKDRIHHTVGDRQIKVELKEAGYGKYYLPFRPLVYGGDDVTFVCDGRLGLALAIEYLKQFEKRSQSLPDGQGQATACAGIAIVKTHYPFARAYELAEDLCSAAKTYRRKIHKANAAWDGSCLDWHFAMSGLSGDIDEIRRREYTTRAGSLTLRPVTLEANMHQSYRAWDVVHKGIQAFQGEHWAGRHNKVKALRDALREGVEAVEHFRLKFNDGKALPAVDSQLTQWLTKGWEEKYCGYFDAIEIADWFIPL